MKYSETDERAFEKHIEKALIGTTREERDAAGQTDVEAQQPGREQCYWGVPKDMDKKLALDMRRLWSFLEATQQDELSKYVGADLKGEVSRKISKDIETFGVIQVLKHERRLRHSRGVSLYDGAHRHEHLRAKSLLKKTVSSNCVNSPGYCLFV